MADENILTAVEDGDPCGPDLQWDPEFMAVGQALDNLIAQSDEAVVDGERTGDGGEFFDEIERGMRGLSARTRDLRLFAIRAEVAWRQGGLPLFAPAFENLVAASETWPDPATGVHPRADEEDGDLGERIAALGRLLNRIPNLAAAIGWGKQEPSPEARAETGTTLRGIFDSWTARLDAAFGSELPSRGEAWRSIQQLIGDADVPGAEAVESAEGAVPGQAVAVKPTTNAWDCIDDAIRLMEAQDRHSPALPVLYMLSRWRSVGIIDISMKMRVSGVTLEQLLDSVHKQLDDPT